MKKKDLCVVDHVVFGALGTDADRKKKKCQGKENQF